MTFGRFYIYPDDGPATNERGKAYPSVTSAIAELHKEEVERWLIEEAKAGRDPDAISREAMRTGRDVHKIAAAKAYGRRVVVPARLRGFVNAWQQWTADHARRFVLVEETVFNLEDQYAGTLDAVVELADGTNVLVDWKCSKRAYPEVALQESAYWRARTLRNVCIDLLCHDARVVVLHEDGTYSQSAVDVGEETYRAFLGLLEAHKWRYRHSDEVLTPVPAVLGWGGSEARKQPTNGRKTQ